MSLSLKKSSTEPHSETSIEKKKINLFIAGIGAVGGTLTQLIKNLNHQQFDLNIIGVCNSRLTKWYPDIDRITNGEKLQEGEPTDWNLIPDELVERSEGNLIFVDATGSEVVAHQYQHLLNHGVHIATPSKRANTFGQEYFDHLIRANNSSKAQYRYETAVGAGLPIVSTLKTLINSGDEITEISGVASGTMTFLFTQLQSGFPFSEAVRKAKEDGYSEPDPRDDLSGEDVARKFLILARTCGYSFERNQIRVDTLVPEKLISHSIEEFLEHLPDYDGHWKSRNAQAMVNNRKLRYVGKFTPDGIQVGVHEVKSDSPLANLKGTDNLIQIYTKRYSTSPIVVQGPGAGRDVTAAGVLGDIIDIGGFV